MENILNSNWSGKRLPYRDLHPYCTQRAGPGRLALCLHITQEQKGPCGAPISPLHLSSPFMPPWLIRAHLRHQAAKPKIPLVCIHRRTELPECHPLPLPMYQYSSVSWDRRHSPNQGFTRVLGRSSRNSREIVSHILSLLNWWVCPIYIPYAEYLKAEEFPSPTICDKLNTEATPPVDGQGQDNGQKRLAN